MRPQYHGNLPAGTRWRHLEPGGGAEFLKTAGRRSKCVLGDGTHFLAGRDYEFGDSVACVPVPFRLLHPSDPDAPRELWHFIYITGLAESFNAAHAEEKGWRWEAPDLCCCHDPIPGAGEYDGTLYGRAVKIVLADPRGNGYMRGRVALADGDPAGLAYARDPDRW